MAEHRLLELRKLVTESPWQGKPQPLVEELERHPLQPVRLPAWGARLAWAVQAFQA
mgnify:CR=1 FL=1